MNLRSRPGIDEDYAKLSWPTPTPTPTPTPSPSGDSGSYNFVLFNYNNI